MRFVVQDWLEPSTVAWPDADAGPWSVTLTWAERDGVAVCVGLALALMPGQEPQPVTATLMRALPVASIVAAARAERYREASMVAEVDARDDFGDMSPAYLAARFAEAAAWAEPRGPGRPVELGPDHYRAVADVYSNALAAGRAPLIAVTERWTVSRPTASRWVKAARDAKFLPATDRGRARGNGTLVNRKGASR